MAKLTAYEIYKKAQKESLTREQCKQLLLDNGIIIKKANAIAVEPVLVAGSFPVNQKLLALSWKEPFANLMFHGKIETRTWPTNYRGLVLICASKSNYSEGKVLEMSDSMFTKIEYLCGHKWEMCLPGYAIAIGYLTDCRLMTKEDEQKCFVKYKEPWIEERISKKTGKKKTVEVKLYCHIYKNVQPIKPMIWEGTQGWKEVSQEIKSTIVVL